MDKDHQKYHTKRSMCWNCTPGKTVLDFCKRVVVRGSLRMTTLHHEGACYLPGMAKHKFIWSLKTVYSLSFDLPEEIYSGLRFGVVDGNYRYYDTYDEAALDFKLAIYKFPEKRTIFQLFGGE